MRTVLRNGTIYTVEGRGWEKDPASAMVYDETGRILYVGCGSGAEAYADGARIIDLSGRAVLPGFIDSHVHVPGVSLVELFQLDLSQCVSFRDTMETIGSYVGAHPDLEAYFGSGFSMGLLDDEGRSPCAAWLDAVCPGKPMILVSADCHSNLFNTRAMKLCGRTRESRTDGIGHIHRDSDGSLTGLFTDVRDLPTMEPSYTTDQMKSALRHFIGMMNRWGYTSIMSIAPHMLVDPALFLDLEREGSLSLRVNTSLMIGREDPGRALKELTELKDRLEAGSGLLKVMTGKIMVDGVIEGKTAFLCEPYAESAGMGPGYHGKPEWEGGALNEAVLAINRAGLQAHMHCIGDAAVEMALDAVEYAQGRLGRRDFRNVITHLQLVREEDKRRIGELGVMAAIQPFWHEKEPEWFDTVECAALGLERAEREYPARSLVDNGAMITASGDYPVTPTNNPFVAIQTGVTRNICDRPSLGIRITDPDARSCLLNRAERLTMREMVEAYTINGARQLFREEETGSLRPGKAADFIVTDRDVFTADILAVNETRVEATVFGGRIVHGAL